MIISSLGLVLLHLFLYGWNLYAWQQTRINYAFIFEHRPGTELRYRQVLCLASGFTTVLLGAMNAHLYISTKEAPRFHVSEFIPLASVLVWLLPGNTKLATIATPNLILLKFEIIIRFTIQLQLYQFLQDL